MVDKVEKDNKLAKEERLKLMNTIMELMTINNIPRIPLTEIKFNKKVGEGGQAKVYKAIYKEEEVAVKILDDIDHKCLAHEIVILSNLKHECIPNFFGLILDEEIIGFVNKYINGKPLDEYKFVDFEENLKVKIINNLANTLLYIHENTFIHRDLKPENMMLDNDMNFYLIDFGIAKVMTNMIDTITRAKGTIYYLAPESLEAAELTDKDEIISKITTKVDVWSFGCIVSYIFSGMLPWTNKYKDNISAIQKLLVSSTEFPVPESEIKAKNYKNQDIIIEIIKSCLHNKSDERLSMRVLIEKFLSKLSY